MNKLFILSVLAVTLCGCYGYGTTRTIKSGDKECAYSVTKTGNAIVGYGENGLTNEKRGEKDCKEWLAK